MKNKKSKFKIQLDHYEPGCGCGCKDNDLNIADQNFHKLFCFYGTIEEAEQELERLKHNACPSYGNSWNLTEEKNKSRLVVISGPSGVGKGPIMEWTKKLYIPDLFQVKVRKTKTERHKGNENDLNFDRSDGKYYRFDCRGTEQRIYLNELDKALEDNGIVLLETYYKAFDFLNDRYCGSVDVESAFISPLDKEEMDDLTKTDRLKKYLTDLMLDSLIKRAERDGKAFTSSLIKELELRAEGSYEEMKFAHNYRYVIPNHCYEADSRWRFSSLVGEPKKVVNSLSSIILTGQSKYAQKGSDYTF